MDAIVHRHPGPFDTLRHMFGEGGSSVVTVIIVDDHTLFSGGLQLLLESATEGHIQVVATTTRAAEAEDLVRRHRPDIAIIDLAMPPPGGAAAIKAVKRRCPQVRVLARVSTAPRWRWVRWPPAPMGSFPSPPTRRSSSARCRR